MALIEPGRSMKVEVVRSADFGYFLSDGVEDVLLHTNEMTDSINVGDMVEVFIYTDKQNRLAATMKIPEIQVGTYGWAEVVDVNMRLGVFVNIGIHKEILVARDALPAIQEVWPALGDKLYMTLEVDRKDRIFGLLATEQVIRDMAKPAPETMHNKDISGRVYNAKKIGSFVITEEGYRCFIHENERKEEPRLGALVQARVIAVKEDGTLNASMLPRKQESRLDDAEKIYQYLQGRGGAMPYGDKTPPNVIQDIFGMSKAGFKRALGKLMKEQKVYQEDGWTLSMERKNK